MPRKKKSSVMDFTCFASNEAGAPMSMTEETNSPALDPSVRVNAVIAISNSGEPQSPASDHVHDEENSGQPLSDVGDTNSKSSALGQTAAADSAVDRSPDAEDTQSPVEGQFAIAQAVPPVPSIGDTVNRIRYWHRQRCFAMEQRKRIDLSLGSFLRMMLGWSLALPESERKAIAKAASDMMDDPDHLEWGAVITASHAARKPFEDIESLSLKEMTKLAMTLPAWSAFGEPIRGFGAGSLAVIVGEAGDLSNYSTKSKLWKRMGLAVMDGVRQGGLGKGASKEAWIVHGYSPTRRSRMWNIGDALIKGNRDGIYRQTYLARKEYELAREPEMKPIKAHRRAQRYMEKNLLKQLWQAWRRTSKVVTEQSLRSLSAAEIPNAPQGAGEAVSFMNPKNKVPLRSSSTHRVPEAALGGVE